MINIALLIERTHWTLDYIRSLDTRDFYSLLAVYEGLDKGRQVLRERAAR